jgi:hypothetical protein
MKIKMKQLWKRAWEGYCPWGVTFTMTTDMKRPTTLFLCVCVCCASWRIALAVLCNDLLRAKGWDKQQRLGRKTVNNIWVSDGSRSACLCRDGKKEKKKQRERIKNLDDAGWIPSSSMVGPWLLTPPQSLILQLESTCL